MQQERSSLIIFVLNRSLVFNVVSQIHYITIAQNNLALTETSQYIQQNL